MLKKLENYDYVLFSNIILTTFLQFRFFNLIGIISVVLSIVYLCFVFFLRDKKVYLAFYILAIITGMIYYLIDTLFKNVNFSNTSIVTIVFFIVVLIHAIIMPIMKRNSFFGIRIRLSLQNDCVWKIVNNMGSIIYYLMLFPLFGLVLYFDDDTKLFLSILTIVVFNVVVLLIALKIEKNYLIKKRKKEMHDLQQQRKIETGG